MTKNLVPALCLTSVTVLAVGFAYFSRYPDSPWLEEAESWPVVGEVATLFREAYLGPRTDFGPPPEASDDDEEDVVYEFVGGTMRPAGERPATPRYAPPTRPVASPGAATRTDARRTMVRTQPALIADASGRVPGVTSPRHLAMPQVVQEWVWALPGQSLYAAPGSEPLRPLSALANLPVLERDGFWAQVRYRGEQRWVDTSWTPSHSRRDARQGGIQRKRLPPRNTAYSRLVKVREALGLKKPNGSLGPYQLYTDVDDPEFIELLGSAAVAAERAYFARYARLPSGDPLRTAVLFADESSYRRYSSGSDLPTQTHVGHAGGGALVLYVGDRPREDVVRTLVHEIAHLLNSRALSYFLPPWLEEGLASDLGSVFLEDDRDISRPGESIGEAIERQKQTHRACRNIALDLILLRELQQAGNLPTIGSIVQADRELFFQRGNVTVGYAYGAALVRYFLDGGHAGGFRRFLGRIADGYEPNAALLTDSLGFGEDPSDGLQTLDQGFRAWLETESTRALEDREAQIRAEIARRYG